MLFQSADAFLKSGHATENRDELGIRGSEDTTDSTDRVKLQPIKPQERVTAPGKWRMVNGTVATSTSADNATTVGELNARCLWNYMKEI